MDSVEHILQEKENKMKPCPFCGSKVSLSFKGSNLVSILCEPESICMGSRLFQGFFISDIDKAVNIWNTRNYATLMN